MRIVKSPLVVIVVATLFSALSFAAQPDRIATIDSSNVVQLSRSLHPQAKQEFDRGLVSASFKLSYVTLVMSPSASQQAALNQLLAQQQDPTSANFRKWLTPAQYADRFGLSQRDIDRVTGWLKSQGFTVLSIGGGRNSVTFSGTAAQVQRAFRTEIHHYNVNGEQHFANATPLMVPAALNGVVKTIRGVHDFRMKPANHARSFRSNADGVRADYHDAAFGANFLAPGDIATIYDFPSSLTGTGQKIAVVGQTDIFLADINDFRNGFGLSTIPTTGGGSCTVNGIGLIISPCTTTNFAYVLVGSDPGTPSANDIGEADLDVEWSGAAAPGAQVIFVNGETAGGVDDALAAVINPSSGPPLAPVVTMSYGICEAFAGDLETELQQGNAEGVTIMNSSGDTGAAGCDYSPPNNNPPFTGAVGGVSVNYPASSPEVTGVGGSAITLANDTSSTYWNTGNGATGGSAKSYIPEIGWNDNEALGAFCLSNPSVSFCNPGSPYVKVTNAQTFQEDYWISIGGGGASNCWTETVNGVCQAGFTQPTWQGGLTVSGAPSGVRWVPDVSLFASPNFPGFIYCTPQDPGSGVYTSTCVSGISTAVETYNSLVGGTSASSPVFAGIVTLINEHVNGTGSSGLGNINSTLYTLAKTPSNGAFHKITTGDNKVYCASGQPTAQPSALRCPTSGTLVVGYSASNADATTGYNLVTGLGSVDVNKLLLAWPAALPPTTTAISSSSGSVNQGTSVTFTATVSPSTATGTVTFNVNSTTSLGNGTLSGGTATLMTTALPPGTDDVTANYNGDLSDAGSTSSAVQVAVAASDFTIGVSPASATVAAGHSAPTSGSITVTITPTHGYNQQTTLSCPGLPSGATCTFNPNMQSPDGVHAITSSMTITTSAGMATGVTPVTVSATNGGTVTHTQAFSLTVNATDQSFTLAAQNQNYEVSQGSSVAATVIVTPGATGFSTPVTYTCTDSVSESGCTPPVGATTTLMPQFTITTTRATGELRKPFDRGMKIFYAVFMPGLLGIVFTLGSRKRSLRGMRLLGLIMVLGFSTLWLGSCGGSNGGSNKDPGTPLGMHTVTVHATTGGANPVTASTTITFTVN
jgi:subtilase family serine protease